jgi:hypothetical protein
LGGFKKGESWSMAEIKSAFELAMERSTKYVISDEEREKIREENSSKGNGSLSPV